MTNNGTSPDTLKIQGRMAKGYGIIPKIPMQDQRLTIEAKAIYSYFCTYAGAGTTAFPSRDKILHDLRISEKRYYSHFNLLKKYGYITVEQYIEGGKFKNNVYTLVEMIEPYSQNEGTEPYGSFEGTQIAYTQNGGNKSNSFKNNNYKNQQGILSTPIISVLKETPQDLKDETEKIRVEEIIMQAQEEKQKKESSQNVTAIQSKQTFTKPSAPRYDYNTLLERIKGNVDYDYILEDSPTYEEMLDEVCHVIAATVCTDYKDGYISMGNEQVHAETVRSVFLKLTKDDIDYFFECFNRQTDPIVKMAAYIRTSLYRNHRTISHHYTNRVHTDMPQLASPKIRMAH